MTTQLCTFPGCKAAMMCRGYCPAHYWQLRRGQPLRPLYQTRRPNGSVPRITYDEVPCPNPALKGPCRIYRGHKGDDGYGKASVNGKTDRVHRYVWERDRGPIPDGMEIDHQCRNRACCNVDHLRVVTHRVNTLENSVGVSALCAARTHCIHGHPFDDVNTIRTKRGARRCRECKRIGEAGRRRLTAKPRQPKTHCPAGHAYDDDNTKISKAGHRSCKQCVREYRKANRARLTEYERQRRQKAKETQ